MVDPKKNFFFPGYPLFIRVFLLITGSWLFIHSANAAPPSKPAEIPEEYLNLKNPVTLTEEQIPYYKKQFLTKCARCHGENGKGVGSDSKDLEARPSDFTDPEFMKSRTDGHLYYQIENGGEDVSAMPDFGPDSAQGWDEEKIWSMVYFIRLFATSK